MTQVRSERQFGELQDGTRIITLEMPIPGWQWVARESDSYLYELPAQRHSPRGRPGWPVAGFSLTLPANKTSSLSLTIEHPPGRPSMTLSPDLGDIGTLATGTDSVTELGTLAIDVRWRPMPDGTRRVGLLTSPAIGELLMAVTYDQNCAFAIGQSVSARKVP